MKDFVDHFVEGAPPWGWQVCYTAQVILILKSLGELQGVQWRLVIALWFVGVLITTLRAAFKVISPAPERMPE